MNKTHLYNILNQYIERYDEFDDDSPTSNDEGYKWRVVSSSYFQLFIISFNGYRPYRLSISTGSP